MCLNVETHLAAVMLGTSSMDARARGSKEKASIVYPVWNQQAMSIVGEQQDFPSTYYSPSPFRFSVLS